MRIDSLRDASPGVTEYHFDGRVIDSGRVEQRGQGMPTLVRGVMHRQPLHCPVPAAPESVVSVDRTNLSAPLPCGQEGEYPLTDGYSAHTGLRLAVPDVDVALADFYILWPQGQVLPDAQARINQYQCILDRLVVGLLPQPVDLTDRKWALFIDDVLPVNLDIPRVVRRGHLALNGELVQLAHEDPALFLCAVSGDFSHVVHGGLQV